MNAPSLLSYTLGLLAVAALSAAGQPAAGAPRGAKTNAFPAIQIAQAPPTNALSLQSLDAGTTLGASGLELPPSLDSISVSRSTTGSVSLENVPDIPPPLTSSDLLSSPSLDLPPIELPELDLSSVSTVPLVLEQPYTTTVMDLDLGFDDPTSVAFSIERTVAFDEPLTNLSLNEVEEFERYINSKTKFVENIDLNAVVVRAVCRNLNIKLSDIDHLIANDEYVAQQGIFDLRISGISQIIRTQTPSGSESGSFSLAALPNEPIVGEGSADGTDPEDTDGTETDGDLGGIGDIGGGGSGDRRTVQNSVTVGQLLPTGGLLELLFDNSKTETSGGEPEAVTRAGLRATQPLLRNAGPLVTQSRIVLAGFDTRITASQVRQRVMEEVALAINYYYDLVFAVSNVDVLRIALIQAEELLRVNRAKYEAGVLPQLDVLQAQADVASRQQAVIVALQQIEAASDLLKAHLAIIEDPQFISLRPADVPRVPEYPISENVFLDEAIAFRPEMEQASYNIEKQGINVRVAWNQTLPQVDLFGSYVPTGAGRTRMGSLEEAARTRTEDWRFGVQFNYPLQNREARFRFHQAEKRVDQTYLRLMQVRNSVILDVRNGVRGVETNRASIAVGRAAVEFNRAKVEAALQRQAAGLATSTDVLDFQSDLANARITLLQSVVDYNQAIVEVERSKGTLLDSLGIMVCDGEIYKAPNLPKKALGLSR